MNPAIQLEHVSKHYKGKIAVDDLSLTIEEGSVVALLGPNGAGKTTTVSMTLGLQQPTSGTIRLLDGSPQDRHVKNRLGAMLQDVNVIDGLKVGETIELFRHYYTNPLSMKQLLKLSDLEAEKGKMATSLSGGQKRRLNFALALAGDPSIMFLDEPTVGMDVTSRRTFWEAIREMAGSGRTIILTTHYLEEADAIADRIVVVNNGRLIADGTPASIKASVSGRTLSFTAGAGVTDETVRRLPGVRRTDWHGRRVSIVSDDTDLLVKAIVLHELEAKDIEIRSGGLEEAFQQLVHHEAKEQEFERR
ncbi:ABC transporter ATP-binding protein [Paenibacillus sp. H1-7]|uniref:ABC transporter ATP-binding protein n=1 Tax=Paenibacillus sp. H1-7 TaxID=2282849 RepID=UPI001EF95B2B|nr:ABC transporter ATP-binding protein [Paenibacillus sp. H1-7]ULL13692.1 ABC transporter ATP-binding protein [Paenibacillus sp. H1-7]